MEPCVSIIVPVYNAEATLSRCVESVLNHAFAQADSRVRVLHKENSGVSDTRNQAMSMAWGRYLQFLDADDWITPNATKLLVRTAEENQCGLVIADFYRVVGDRVSPKGDIDENGPLTREEYAAHMMENPADFYYGVLWNKLYRRDIIASHGLRMDPEVSWCEDFLFNLEYIRHARRFFALQVPIYYYVKTKGSLVNQGISISKTVRTKLMLFEYYNQFYKTVLDEAEYEKSRLKVYRFLIDAAQDGAAPPLPLVSTRLGSERTQAHSSALAAKGMVSVSETRSPGSRDKQLRLSFPSGAEPVLSELEEALKDFESTLLSGFSGEERAQYAQMSRRVQENIWNVLQNKQMR